MGNAQSQSSAEAPRRASQRLSKPKTGNPAAAGLLSPGPFSNTSRRLSNVPLPDPPPPPSTVASTPTTSSAPEPSPRGFGSRIESVTSLHSAPGSQGEPRSKRRSFFRSRSSSRRPDPAAQLAHGAGAGSRAVDRMTRASSMTYESAVAYYGQAAALDNPPAQLEHRTSWNYNLSSYEAKRLLNLTEEPGLDHAGTMSEIRTTVATETDGRSSNPAHPPSAPLTRANSDVSLYMPVRRRSIIQTPGVATRSNSTRDLPPLPPVNFRHSHPPTPSLSRQHSIESYRSGIVSMPPRLQDPDSMPRVETPCEEKYLSIGAFKLGSLRITNGSPSPRTPETERARGNEERGAGQIVTRDGYFLGSQTPGSPPVTLTQLLPEIGRNPSSTPTLAQPTSSALQTTSKVTADEDQLFDDEVVQQEYSAALETLDVRLDPEAKPAHLLAGPDTTPDVARTNSDSVSTAGAAPEIQYNSLAKADSGYSSDVSLRSFHAKPAAADHHAVPPSLEQEAPKSSAQWVGPEQQDSSGQSDVYPAAPERESPPPPVPPKDIVGYPPISHLKQGGDAKNTVPMHNLAERSRTNSTLGMRHIVSAIATFPAGVRGPASPASEPLSPASARSSASATTGSGSSVSVPQKTSRLQRLLGGESRLGAGSPTVQGTADLEKEFVPPVPREAEHRLHEHAGRPSTGSKRLAPKSRSSLDTLKTIFSVGSLETSLDAVNALQTVPNVPKSESKPGLWKQTWSAVPASIANAAAHVIPRKPITRKPVPVRQESEAVNTTSDESDGRSVLPPLLRSSHRTASLTTLGEKGTKLRHRMSDQTLTRSTADFPFPAPPSPVAKALSLDKTSRPVNPARRPLSLRVPPPLRSQSVASLSRRTSRESLQSYPAIHSLASKTSVDSFQSYSSSQPGGGSGSVPSTSPGEGSMDPRRLQSFRQYHSPQSSPYSSPDWEAQTDLGAGNRRNSISSVQSEGGFHAGSAQQWQIRTAQQTLRHRASYDGYGHPQRFSQYGHPPSMSNGYTAPVKAGYGPPPRRQLDAASTWSRSQADAAAGQRYQGGGQYHLQAPRGHYRNRSMGNGNGPNPPYRVLHSYNSPAYRNAPIWG